MNYVMARLWFLEHFALGGYIHEEALKKGLEAIEKQIQKKVENWNGQASCPNCKKLYGNMEDIKKLSFWDFDYCKYCGQKLDWGDSN